MFFPNWHQLGIRKELPTGSVAGLATFPSRSPIDNNARPQWALAADANIRVDSTSFWGGGRPSADGEIPPHPDPDGKPAGANVLTFDGAVAWIPRGKLIPWHRWSTIARVSFCYQVDLGEYGQTHPPGASSDRGPGIHSNLLRGLEAHLKTCRPRGMGIVPTHGLEGMWHATAWKAVLLVHRPGLWGWMKRSPST